MVPRSSNCLGLFGADHAAPELRLLHIVLLKPGDVQLFTFIPKSRVHESKCCGDEKLDSEVMEVVNNTLQ